MALSQPHAGMAQGPPPRPGPGRVGGPRGHAPLQPAPICSLLKGTPRVLAKICPLGHVLPRVTTTPLQGAPCRGLGSVWGPSEGLTSASHQMGKLRLYEEGWEGPGPGWAHTLTEGLGHQLLPAVALSLLPVPAPGCCPGEQGARWGVDGVRTGPLRLPRRWRQAWTWGPGQGRWACGWLARGSGPRKCPWELPLWGVKEQEIPL